MYGLYYLHMRQEGSDLTTFRDPHGGPVAARHLRDYLLSRGSHTVDVTDVTTLTGLPERQATATMTRLRRAGQFFSPTPGLYVAIPPEYASWGAIPAMDFIAQLMHKLNRRYYIGLLSAAELHGAAHQRPQVFQVMVDKQVTDRDFGRVRLRFYSRAKLDRFPTVLRNSATGKVRVATPETTALDLASRPQDAGGLDNVATVLGELVSDQRLTPAGLDTAAPLYHRSVLRRLGWLLDRITDDADTAALALPLEQLLTERGPRKRPTDLLDPAGRRRGTTSNRWGLIENVEIEPDL